MGYGGIVNCNKIKIHTRKYVGFIENVHFTVDFDEIHRIIKTDQDIYKGIYRERDLKRLFIRFSSLLLCVLRMRWCGVIDKNEYKF